MSEGKRIGEAAELRPALRKGAATGQPAAAYLPQPARGCGVRGHTERDSSKPCSLFHHDQSRLREKSGAASSSLTTPFPHQLATPRRRGDAIRWGCRTVVRLPADTQEPLSWMRRNDRNHQPVIWPCR